MFMHLNYKILLQIITATNDTDTSSSFDSGMEIDKEPYYLLTSLSILRLNHRSVVAIC